jgi:uncharacterized protein YjiS (DUF1127 family)
MIAKTDTRYHRGLALPHSDVLRVWLRALHAIADRVGWALWRWLQVQQTRKQLFALPDHMLKDIGLSRSNLISATLHRVREEEAIRRGFQG